MRKLFLLLFLFVSFVILASSPKEITIKANVRGGRILYSDQPSKIIAPGPLWGGEIVCQARD